MHLSVIDKEGRFSTYDLDPGREYTMGRSPECDIRIASEMASRTHARLFFKKPSWRIEDLDSTNGTFVNEKSVSNSEINNYDVAMIGDVILEFNEETGKIAVPENDKADESLLSSKVDEKILESFENFKKILHSQASLTLIEANGLKDKILGLIKKLDPAAACLQEVEKHFGAFGEFIKPHGIISKTDLLKENAYSIIKESAIEINRINHELKVLFELTKSISEILNLKHLLNVVMDLVNQIISIERGVVLLYDASSKNFVPYVSRKMGLGALAFEDNSVSRAILNEMQSKGKPVLIKNSLFDLRFVSSESVRALSGKSILCSPLYNKQGNLQGAFYLEKNVKRPFTEKDALFLQNFAGSISVAVENAKLMMTVKREKTIRNNMERYISPNIIDQLVNTKGDLRLNGEKREITVIFADIKNFTTISEKIDVESVFTMLNTVFSAASEVIFEHDGTIDKFIGDAIMAFFGAPIGHDDDALRSVKVAVNIIKIVEKMSGSFEKEHGLKLGFSIGINTGDAIVGNVGSPNRMEYTAIGDTVNLASRLQSKAGFNEIVINETTYEKIKNYVKCVPIESFKVKGKSQPIKAYMIKAGDYS